MIVSKTIVKTEKTNISLDQDEVEKILLEHFRIKNGSVDFGCGRWLDYICISGEDIVEETGE